MKKVVSIIFVLVTIFLVFGLIFIKINLSAFSLDSKNQVFVINAGDSIKTISQNLEEKDLIKNHFVFIAYSFLTRQNKKIQSGTYRLSPSLSTPELLEKLTTGGISDYWLKIPDGSRLEETANLFPKDLTFTSQDFLTQTKNKEGYLFPDSYLIPQYFSLDQTLKVIYDHFNQKFTQAKKDSTSTLSDQKILVLASLLEREGKSLESKQMIAGIILNRLSINMALQLDATVQYARDSQNKNIKEYWQPITKSSLSINSVYNTYKNTGLPPKPICSPGYNSLYAAFHPTDSNYIYYITGDDGLMHYAITLAEHNSNIAKYLK
ncbi:MAG: endolytic transglycosylase MltG [Candidatus Shapirobacteria bacterium]|nr:endolytic transglycosylase MltG [Candidatus Shapirobacteria bacterium]